MGMSTREKFLIILLGAVVILLGGFKLLIEPKLSSISLIRQELISAKSEKQKYLNDINLAEEIEKQNKKLEDDIASNSAAFFGELENDNVHLFFKNITDNLGVDIDLITMSPKAYTVITNPEKNQEPTYPAKDAIEKIQPKKETTTSSGASKPTNNTVPNDTVEVMQVSVRFAGSYYQAANFIDLLNKTNKTVRLSSLNIAKNKDGAIIVTVNSECFGVKKYLASNDNNIDGSVGKSDPFN